ncbi:MAG TPA: SMP-30/gluconolactonase/LRE family protein [Planctomycetaceae bacterium]|nr:SMP-30/gluconolactonase/LRE family protein [Planctomycetaceae bacterium]
MRLLICAAALAASLNVVVAEDKPAGPSLKVVWSVDKGLAAPESAYLDPETGFLFVSNIDGEGAKKDGNGYISKLTPQGEVIAAKWATGLDAPKGLRSAKGKLWVSDIDQVVSISLADGKILDRIAIEGAKFLNDVAAGPDGTVYVSDMPESKIYAISGGKATLFAEGEELDSPNGLLVDGDRMLLAAWGYAADFMPKTPGRLLSLDLKTKQVTPITKAPTGNLDGIELDGQGGYVVTDWAAGKVFHISAGGAPRLVAQFAKGTADHAYLPKEKLLILPHMMENRVVAYELAP